MSIKKLKYCFCIFNKNNKSEIIFKWDFSQSSRYVILFNKKILIVHQTDTLIEM